jgi:fructose-1,6-bisphosphatase
VAAGYVLYGPSTVLVMTVGSGVQMFVLDPSIGSFLLVDDDVRIPDGKLRLMYEANPMSMLMEQAGGKAFSGTQRTMEIEPERIHQRTSVVMGSPSEVDRVLSFL